jgi:hypothetical protein
MYDVKYYKKQRITKFREPKSVGGLVVHTKSPYLTLDAGYKADMDLSQTWAGFLEKYNPYHWYGHLTFQDDTHPEQADKLFMLWVHILNRKIYGSNYWKDQSKGVYWARGTEYQKRGVIHYHFIMGLFPRDTALNMTLSKYSTMDKKTLRLNCKEKWYELAGIARIYPYLASRGAEYYMSKSSYAFKRGQIDVSRNIAL